MEPGGGDGRSEDFTMISCYSFDGYRITLRASDGDLEPDEEATLVL